MVLNAYGETVTDEWLEEYSRDTFTITQRMIWDAVEEFGRTDYCEGYGADGEEIAAWAGPYMMTVELSTAGGAWVLLRFLEDYDVMPDPEEAAQQARMSMSLRWLTEYAPMAGEYSIMCGALNGKGTLAAVREALDYMAQHWVW